MFLIPKFQLPLHFKLQSALASIQFVTKPNISDSNKNRYYWKWQRRSISEVSFSQFESKFLHMAFIDILYVVTRNLKSFCILLNHNTNQKRNMVRILQDQNNKKQIKFETLNRYSITITPNRPEKLTFASSSMPSSCLQWHASCAQNHERYLKTQIKFHQCFSKQQSIFPFTLHNTERERGERCSPIFACLAELNGVCDQGSPYYYMIQVFSAHWAFQVPLDFQEVSVYWAFQVLIVQLAFSLGKIGTAGPIKPLGGKKKKKVQNLYFRVRYKV